MALWRVNGEIKFSEGAYSVSNPPSSMMVVRHSYKVPYSNLGKGGITTLNGKTYHMPSWTEVHPKTTLDDIEIDKKPFEELFVEPQTWSFKSATSNKEYTVKLNKANKLSCDCWGYIAHRKCKHINEVTEKLA